MLLVLCRRFCACPGDELARGRLVADIVVKQCDRVEFELGIHGIWQLCVGLCLVIRELLMAVQVVAFAVAVLPVEVPSQIWNQLIPQEVILVAALRVPPGEIARHPRLWNKGAANAITVAYSIPSHPKVGMCLCMNVRGAKMQKEITDAI